MKLFLYIIGVTCMFFLIHLYGFGAALLCVGVVIFAMFQ